MKAGLILNEKKSTPPEFSAGLVVVMGKNNPHRIVGIILGCFFFILAFSNFFFFGVDKQLNNFFR